MQTKDTRWAFFSYDHNLCDFTRALETAQEMQKTGSTVKFFTHGGVHNEKIKETSVEHENLLPEISWEQHEVIMDINRYKVPVGTPIPISTEQWIKMAEADLKAFDEFKPHGVYIGLSLSGRISAQYAKLPTVTQVPTVNCPAFIHNELYNMPNTMEKNFFIRHVLPGKVKRKIMKKILLADLAKASVTTFNEARKKFGLKPIYNITDLARADMTLLPDLPELSGLPEDKLTEGYYYTAPIFAKLNLPIPYEIKKVYSNEGINVFISLGSSGFPETLKFIVKTLRKDKRFNIVCATTTIVDPIELGENNNRFYACRFLPSYLVNEMADIAITHGGQATIQTAIWAGTPLVGIGFQAEQQSNIDGVARAGMAVRIPIYAVTEKTILKAVNKILQPEFKENARKMQKRLRSTNGLKKTIELMNNFILNKYK